MRFLFFFFFSVSFLFSPLLWAQFIKTEELYGDKNRIQYEKFRWRYIESDNFKVFYYERGYKIATQLIKYAEKEYFRIVNLIGYSPYDKIEVFLYNSSTDKLQSNLGINYQQYLLAGQTSFIRDEIEIAFTGEEHLFQQEIIQSIADLLIFKMIYGSSLKDFIKNKMLYIFPQWYLSGASRYIGKGWSKDMDDYMRYYFNMKRRKKIHKIKGRQATIIGQSIWNYIVIRYGERYISDILNYTRVTANIKNIISTILQTPYKTFIGQWEEYYTKNISVEMKKYIDISDSLLIKKKNKKITFNDIKISPDGNFVAYTLNKKGKYKVYIMDVKTKKKKLVLKTGYLLMNQKSFEHIPSIRWRNSEQMMIMGVDRGENFLWLFDFSKKKKRLFNKRHFSSFNNIQGFDISSDGNYLVISGDQNGKSDIFIHDYKNRKIRNITNDIYDDIDPSFLPGTEKIVFSSNRMKQKNYKRDDKEIFNLYLYDPQAVKTPISPLTFTEARNTNMKFIDKEKILFLNDQTGIHQLYSYNFKTQITKQLLDFGYSIQDFDYYDKTLYFTAKRDLREGLYQLNDIDVNQVKFTDKTFREKLFIAQRQIERKKQQTSQNSIQNISANEVPNDGEIDTENYSFSNYSYQYRQHIIEKFTNRFQKKTAQVYNKSQPYEGQYALDKFTLMPMIHPLMGFNILFQIKTTDIFENHKIDFGIFGVDFKTSSLFAQYLYLRERIDYKIRFERKTLDLNEFNHNLHHLYLTASYPFDIVSRLSFSPFFTYNNISSKFTNSVGNNVNDTRNYIGLRTEFVFDNTQVREKNYLTGLRYNFRLDFSYNLENAGLSFGNISFDGRYYFPINDEITLATRLSMGHFFGPSPKNYMVGGIENNFYPGFENHQKQDNPMIGTERGNISLLLNEFITPLRAFNLNKIYGNSYILTNIELRIPIVRYIYPHHIKSKFFRNFQITTFFDIGTAWNEGNPFSKNNSINTNSITSGLFQIKVFNYNDAFLSDYGVGLRTTFLGYYIKVDYVIGIENMTELQPKWVVSINYDF